MLSQDFKEFIELLNSNDVRYLIIGGYALAAYGCPRFTKDIDIWVDAVEDNAIKLVKSLHQFGFASLGLKTEDFLQSNCMIQLGYPPNRIDLLTSADGVEFKSAYEKRKILIIDGIPVSFIDVENLKINKAKTGRAQDLADLEQLGKLSGPGE